jgi:hypothetical protein
VDLLGREVVALPQGYCSRPNHMVGFDGSRILTGQLVRSMAMIWFERAARCFAIRKMTTKVFLGRHARQFERGNEIWRGLDAANDGERE